MLPAIYSWMILKILMLLWAIEDSLDVFLMIAIVTIGLPVFILGILTGADFILKEGSSK